MRVLKKFLKRCPEMSLNDLQKSVIIYNRKATEKYRLLALSTTVVLFFSVKSVKKYTGGYITLGELVKDFNASLLKFLAERSDIFGIWLILPEKKACFKTNKSIQTLSILRNEKRNR